MLATTSSSTRSSIVKNGRPRRRRDLTAAASPCAHREQLAWVSIAHFRNAREPLLADDEFCSTRTCTWGVALVSALILQDTWFWLLLRPARAQGTPSSPDRQRLELELLGGLGVALNNTLGRRLPNLMDGIREGSRVVTCDFLLNKFRSEILVCALSNVSAIVEISLDAILAFLYSLKYGNT
jgi:hypothetical protein